MKVQDSANVVVHGNVDIEGACDTVSHLKQVVVALENRLIVSLSVRFFNNCRQAKPFILVDDGQLLDDIVVVTVEAYQ
jgi:hypothetical protein